MRELIANDAELTADMIQIVLNLPPNLTIRCKQQYFGERWPWRTPLITVFYKARKGPLLMRLPTTYINNTDGEMRVAIRDSLDGVIEGCQREFFSCQMAKKQRRTTKVHTTKWR